MENSLPLNQIILGDCFKVMQKFPPHSIDMIFTDPPYNIGQNEKLTKVGNKIKTNKQAWGQAFQDDFSDAQYYKFMSRLARMFKRLLKPGGSLIIFYDRGKPWFLKPFYDCLIFRNIFVYEKLNPLPHFRKNNYRSAYEQSMWFTKGKAKTFNFQEQHLMKNILRGEIGKRTTNHPTEKYLWMIEPHVLVHTNPGDIILDPFSGSGTISWAAAKHGRQYIGIEMNEKYWKESTDRLRGVQPIEKSGKVEQLNLWEAA